MKWGNCVVEFKILFLLLSAQLPCGALDTGTLARVTLLPGGKNRLLKRVNKHDTHGSQSGVAIK
jgi:hypothetical protein